VFKPVPFMERCRRRYGRVFCARLGPGQRVVFLSDPELVEGIFTGDPEVFRTGDVNGLFRRIIGPSSVLLLDGEQHIQRRRMMLPSFHGENLERFQATMVEAAEEGVAKWPTGTPFPALPRMHEISTEIIARAVLGVRDEDQLERLRQALPFFLERCRTPAFLIPVFRRELGGRSGWAKLLRSVRDLDAILFEEIRERRNEDVRGRFDALSMLISARDSRSQSLTDDEIRDELVTLLVAGHETTSGALAFAVEQLVQHPRVLDRLEAELAAGNDDYLEAVVKESLRRRPVLPIAGRKLSAPVRLRGYVLPAGTVLLACAYLLHHEPDLYPYPDEFRPERFLEDPPSTYEWIPFGGGIRRCLGASFATQEMKIVLGTMFKRLSLRAAGQTEPPVRRSVSLAPSRGTELVAEPPRGGFSV
jgi:cytochrome P450